MSPHRVYTYTGDGACRTCGAPLLWFETPSGKRLPVDDCRAVRNPGRPDGLWHLGDTLDRERACGSLLVHNHFSTCPGAGQHRRQR